MEIRSHKVRSTTGPRRRLPGVREGLRTRRKRAAKVDPIFSEHRVNPVPVRVIIDKNGKVKHIEFLSAFPDQAKAISDALGQWKFKPYLQDGHPVEVETGIMFGRAARSTTTTTSSSSVE
jgi:hypothetical protein